MANVMDLTTRWKLFHTLEAQIFGMLQKDGALSFTDVDTSLENFRLAGSNLVFSDIVAASNDKVEVRLWEAVTIINSRYRKMLAKFDLDVHRKNHVEKRKLLKRYVDFLKTSQYFYKTFVQSLASRFNIPELHKIAHNMQLSTLSVEREEPNVSAEAHAVLSCHSTLLRLGDLSRYRNVVRSKNRSWDTSLNYYALANELCPDNGLAYNQMAVIAVADKDHVNALYYLYRALAINEPSPMAHNNLLIQLKKIQEEWNGLKQIAPRIPPTGTEALETWFTRLHTKLYKGLEFSGHNELEHEVLGQLQVILKGKNATDLLNKFILVNVGAEYFAGVRVTEAPTDEHFQAYRFFLRLNVRMFTMLLQVYQPQLQKSDNSAPDVTGQLNKDNETFTVLARRILPGIRLYSTWLLGRAAIVVEQSKNDQLTMYIATMWQTYADTLSLIVSNYHADDLLQVDYLLEEDEETIGFKPFREIEDCRHYLDYEGRLKPCAAHPAYPSDTGPQRNHPNTEMLSRVRDILRIGLQLSTDGMYPINMVDGPAFVYAVPEVTGAQSQVAENPTPQSNGNETVSWEVVPYNYDGPVNEPETVEDSSTQLDRIEDTTPDGEVPQHQLFSRVSSPAVSDSCQSMSMSGEMYRMVDDLTTPTAAKDFRGYNGLNHVKEASYEARNSTNYELREQHKRGQSGSSLRGSGDLFFGHSPFAPLPGEVPLTGREPKMSRFGRSATQSTSPSQANGHSGSDSGDQWRQKNGGPVQVDTPSRSQAQPTDAEINLQKYQYRPTQDLPSSNFTDNSSIYHGTPAHVNSLNWANVTNAFGQGQHRSAYYTGGRGGHFPVPSMIQSSLWDGSQPAANKYMATPPGGQGG